MKVKQLRAFITNERVQHLLLRDDISELSVEFKKAVSDSLYLHDVWEVDPITERAVQYFVEEVKEQLAIDLSMLPGVFYEEGTVHLGFVIEVFNDIELLEHLRDDDLFDKWTTLKNLLKLNRRILGNEDLIAKVSKEAEQLFHQILDEVQERYDLNLPRSPG